MLRLIFFILAALCYCECVFVTSSFWAPLLNPRILNYRVDIPFNPEAGKNARENFASQHGDKGEQLIANLGNGKGPNEIEKIKDTKDYGPIDFYYTYSGASNKDKYGFYN